MIELPCDECRTLTDATFLERCDVFPLDAVCPACLHELYVDDEDPRETDQP